MMQREGGEERERQCVCVCVMERERQREREKERGRERQQERERERESERTRGGEEGGTFSMPETRSLGVGAGSCSIPAGGGEMN